MSQSRRVPPSAMTVDAFLVWAEAEQGRWELVEGEPIAMAPERYVHARLKSDIARKLANSVEQAGLNCEVLVDGMGVRVSDTEYYIPDVIVRRGPELARDATEVPDPLIVVEVASPSTAWRGESSKLASYVALPCIAHYLLVAPKDRRLIHLERRDATTFTTRIWGDQPIRLDPPGITLDPVF